MSFKYLVRLEFECNALVEKPDVIGAIFGQTEGMLGKEFDLKELQDSQRIGRIEVKIEKKGKKTKGIIEFSSNLSLPETATLAATIESIEKIGFSNAKIKLLEIKDLREEKRKFILERSKEILEEFYSKMPDIYKEIQKLKEEALAKEIVDYKGLYAGPEMETSDEIILVEGRADIINLLRAGIKNTLAINGAKMNSKVLKEATEGKIVTAFLDGDRAGDLILKRLQQFIDIDFVARAPRGKEVEELTKKEILHCLKNRQTFKQGMKRRDRKREIDRQKVKGILDDLLGTRACVLIDGRYNVIHRMPISELSEILDTAELDNVFAIVMDGVISEDLAKKVAKKRIPYLIGIDKEFKIKLRGLEVITKDELDEGEK